MPTPTITNHDSVTLRCPKCGQKQPKAKRDPSDPPEAVVVETPCPECVGSDFSSVTYYDAEGEEVFQQ